MRRLRWILFFVYCLFIIYYTILKRTPTGNHEVEWGLLWSYRLLLAGAPTGRQTVIQNLSNIAFFIPFGLLIPVKRWWKVAVVALCLSVGVEVVQYVGGYGLAEIDDVICNVLGAMIGYFIVIGLDKLSGRWRTQFEKSG